MKSIALVNSQRDLGHPQRDIAHPMTPEQFQAQAPKFVRVARQRVGRTEMCHIVENPNRPAEMLKEAQTAFL